ncbi:MAG: signal peptidase II [Deferribacteraceae bacterium]|jgi:signal peptidase II|nr:signal peptidase II [Deferribacteraceae bacterium]
MRSLVLIILFIVLLAADQLSKLAVQQSLRLYESVEVIAGLFNITYVLNPGAAFGIFQNQPESFRKIFFIVVTIVAVIMIFMMLRKDYAYRLRSVAYVMIIVGAVGNAIDRIRVGMVVDFLDVYYKSFHWYTFNVADICITSGVGLLLLEMLLLSKKKVK